MGKIRLLEKNIYELIAAGEVIERPASVVTTLRRMYPKMLILGGVAAAQVSLFQAEEASSKAAADT